jgi:hypothetical protein
METSAVSGYNITEAFMKICGNIVEKIEHSVFSALCCEILFY